jgi:hypothetical protein
MRRPRVISSLNFNFGTGWRLIVASAQAGLPLGKRQGACRLGSRLYLRAGLDALEKRKYLASCRYQTQSLDRTVVVISLPDFTGSYKKVALTFKMKR